MKSNDSGNNFQINDQYNDNYSHNSNESNYDENKSSPYSHLYDSKNTKIEAKHKGKDIDNEIRYNNKNQNNFQNPHSNEQNLNNSAISLYQSNSKNTYNENNERNDIFTNNNSYDYQTNHQSNYTNFSNSTHYHANSAYYLDNHYPTHSNENNNYSMYSMSELESEGAIKKEYIKKARSDLNILPTEFGLKMKQVSNIFLFSIFTLQLSTLGLLIKEYPSFTKRGLVRVYSAIPLFFLMVFSFNKYNSSICEQAYNSLRAQYKPAEINEMIKSYHRINSGNKNGKCGLNVVNKNI